MYLGLVGKQGVKIIDFGVGIGKFIEVFVVREEMYEVFVVELLDFMRDVLVVKRLMGVEMKNGMVIDIGVEDGWVDVVVVVQVS